MIIKNLYNVVVAAVAFWLSGYGLAFASPEFFVGSQKTFYASYGFESI
jgi:Amt family ammonium transporter